MIRASAKKEWDKLAANNKNLPIIDHIDITPSFIKAFKELYSAKPAEIDGEWAHKLYDTHGFDGEAIEQLAQVLNIKFNPETYVNKMEEIKLKSKSNRQIFVDKLTTAMAENDLKKTDDTAKYSYNKTGTKYIFPEVQSQVLQIIDKDQFIFEAKDETSCSLILDKTNLYCEAGGQESDRGTIKFQDAIFSIDSITKINDIIIHRGHLSGNSLKIGSQGAVSIDHNFRLSNMRNHTCAHLLNAAIKQIKTATCQKSSKVTHLYVNLDVSVFGPKLNLDDIVKIENIISNVIKHKTEVRVNQTDSQGLYCYEQVTLIPGEVYPDNEIRVIEIEDGNFVSR